MENYQIRSKVHPKQRVAVLLKEDSENGNLTYGTVEEILTKTDTHYRGIKVRIKPEEETEEEKEIRKSNPDYRLVGRIKMFLPKLKYWQAISGDQNITEARKKFLFLSRKIQRRHLSIMGLTRSLMTTLTSGNL